MPARLLFDITQIDLDQVAVSAEEVGAINPQCGDMRQLNHVIWINDQATKAPARTSGLPRSKSWVLPRRGRPEMAAGTVATPRS